MNYKLMQPPFVMKEYSEMSRRDCKKLITVGWIGELFLNQRSYISVNRPVIIGFRNKKWM
ncbi:hypothetical protein A7309_19895 [Paenibacillus polymyxa]|nr:hypothetical protein A7309_19895 [Paenibacillus polymyxa]